MSLKLWALRALLFAFALSFTFFALQSGDVFMYLSLARDFIVQGQWPSVDPYLYSLTHAPLQMAHEYLSYLLFYGAWAVGGVAGLVLLKMLVLATVFVVVLRRSNDSPLWLGLWILAVFAASFRFIERSSLFSDLFCILLLSWLVDTRKITRGLVVKLTLLFGVWVQLHPGYPLGFLILGVWLLWNAFHTPEFRTPRMLWMMLPVLVVVANPRGVEGALYPFRFALNEAPIFKHYTLEWFPTYHPAFRFTPEVLAFWTIMFVSLCLLARENGWRSLRGVLALLLLLCGTLAVRFTGWTSFGVLLLVSPWATLRSPRLPQRAMQIGLAALMAAVAIRNLSFGYSGSSGHRTPSLELDPAFFPQSTLAFLRDHPIAGRLYNSQDFGGYLIWQGQVPIFDHGFVTDMDFYRDDVVGVFQSQERFLQLAKKYNWTMLMVDKHNGYRYFYRILSPLPNWKIVAEDDASYLIYDLPERPSSP